MMAAASAACCHAAAVVRDLELERWACEQLGARGKEAYPLLSSSGRMFYAVRRGGAGRGGAVRQGHSHQPHWASSSAHQSAP